jgi:hypothetical protein
MRAIVGKDSVLEDGKYRIPHVADSVCACVSLYQTRVSRQLWKTSINDDRYLRPPKLNHLLFLDLIPASMARGHPPTGPALCVNAD